MAREHKGEGKPRKNADGSWVQWLDLGYSSGKRIRKKVQAKDRNAVKRKVAELRRKHEAGIDITKKPQTVKALVTDWMDIDFKTRAEPKSIDTYQWAIDRCIVPHIGDEDAEKLTRKQVQAMLNSLADEGMKPASINLARTVLSAALEQAVLDDELLRNVAGQTKPLKVDSSAGKSLTRDQARALLEAARGDRLEVAIRIALSLGLRRGEVCGLRWQDIDFDAGTLTVNGKLVYIKGQGLVYGDPKTDSGQRTLKLGAKLLTSLRWHEIHLAAERMAMGEKWKPSEYVFVSVTNGGPLNPGVFYDAFKKAAKKAEIGSFRLHDLRHSCASFLAAQGYSRKQVQAILGHANPQITERLYTHLFPDTLADVGDGVEDYLDETSGTAKRRRAEGK